MAWSPTEESVYYVETGSEGPTMYSVRYTVVGSALTPLVPEALFTLAEHKRYQRTFDITPNGERFLFVRAVETAAASVRREPTIVLNWSSELERVVPAK